MKNAEKTRIMVFTISVLLVNRHALLSFNFFLCSTKFSLEVLGYQKNAQTLEQMPQAKDTQPNKTRMTEVNYKLRV